jgi:hypothetical protein
MEDDQAAKLLDGIRDLNASVMRLESLLGRMERNSHRHLKKEEIRAVTEHVYFHGADWEVSRQIETILKRESPSCALCRGALENVLWSKARKLK